MNRIFESRFLLEEGVYWRYMTDEKRNLNQKDIHFTQVWRPLWPMPIRWSLRLRSLRRED